MARTQSLLQTRELGRQRHLLTYTVATLVVGCLPRTCRCSNINWSWRDTCNTCNMKRPEKQEDRTGRGGGFNERQDEYVVCCHLLCHFHCHLHCHLHRPPQSRRSSHILLASLLLLLLPQQGPCEASQPGRG